MKRVAKKLSLSRETLRRLEPEYLKNVAGAETYATTANCPTLGAFTCGCETGTACQISLCICQ